MIIINIIIIIEGRRTTCKSTSPSRRVTHLNILRFSAGDVPQSFCTTKNVSTTMFPQTDRDQSGGQTRVPQQPRSREVIGKNPRRPHPYSRHTCLHRHEREPKSPEAQRLPPSSSNNATAGFSTNSATDIANFPKFLSGSLSDQQEATT